jgi:hypothetical protein
MPFTDSPRLDTGADVRLNQDASRQLERYLDTEEVDGFESIRAYHSKNPRILGR